MPATFTRNSKGQWMPAIPEPFYGILRKHCDCGLKFWTRERYREHYVFVHIWLGVPTQ